MLRLAGNAAPTFGSKGGSGPNRVRDATAMTETLSIPSLTLRVRSLDRSGEFYVRQLGFFLVHHGHEKLELAVAPGGAPVLMLIPGAARPAPRESAGLFHAALLLPNSETLASWLAFTAAQGIEFEGFSDHGVSEAIYLSDPDGIGLEVYTDRPSPEWPRAHGELAMTTRPLAIRPLLEKAQPTSTPLAGGRWGHLHLRVTDLLQSETYYRTTLGLDVTQSTYPGARFLAADGYHHHLGINTWGRPTLPAPIDAAGLADGVFALASATFEEKHTDPDGIPLRVIPLSPSPPESLPVNAQ